MSIWGIIIGGTAGFALGRPIGGLLGAVAGHAVESKFNPSRPDPHATKKIACARGTFQNAQSGHLQVFRISHLLLFRNRVSVKWAFCRAE